MEPSVVVLSKNLPNAHIIEIQRIPLATAIIGFGLHKDRLGSDLLQSFVGIVQEILPVSVVICNQGESTALTMR